MGVPNKSEDAVVKQNRDALNDAANGVALSVKDGTKFAECSEHLADICKKVSKVFDCAFADIKLSNDLEGEAVAELMMAWHDVGNSWSALAAGMHNLAVSLRKELAETELYLKEIVDKASLLLKKLAKIAKPLKEPVDKEVEQDRFEEQETIVLSLGALEKQLRIDKQMSSDVIMQAVGEARRHAKPIAGKLVVCARTADQEQHTPHEFRERVDQPSQLQAKEEDIRQTEGSAERYRKAEEEKSKLIKQLQSQLDAYDRERAR